MALITKICDTTYRLQEQVEQQPEWTMIASIEQTVEYHVMYQGAVLRIVPDNITPKCLEDMCKE